MIMCCDGLDFSTECLTAISKTKQSRRPCSFLRIQHVQRDASREDPNTTTNTNDGFGTNPDVLHHEYFLATGQTNIRADIAGVQIQFRGEVHMDLGLTSLL